MESGRRLVQHVEDAEESAAQLGRQVQALEFTTGQGRGGSCGLEVAEPDIDHGLDVVLKDVNEREGGLPAFHGELVGRRVGAGGVEERGEPGKGEASGVGDVRTGDRDRECFRIEALAVADGAQLVGHEGGGRRTHPGRRRVRKGVLDPPLGAHVRAVVAIIHADGGLLVRGEHPLAGVGGQ